MMLISMTWMLGLGLITLQLSKKWHMPALLGYLFIGIIVGPYALDVISPVVLDIGPDLKQIALVIILIRAGLTLNIQDLKKVGKSALLMCFLPATIEIVASLIFAPILLGVSYLDAFLIGTVIAAVSPAVVVPRMVSMIDQGKGTQQGIPQVILAGASADDIYVLVLFSAVLGLFTGGQWQQTSLLAVPSSIALGALVGCLLGIVLSRIIHALKLTPILSSLWLLVVSFLLILAESTFQPWFSGLIAVIALAMQCAYRLPELSLRIKHYFNQYWLVAEIFLFMLVGMDTNVQTALDYAWIPVLFILITSVCRLLGVYLSLIPSHFSRSEKWFTMGAYLPKATVQAAIGSIPLTLGLPNGSLILTISVLEILLTAPLGALWIDVMQDRLLKSVEDS